ncbi:MAG: CHC2 zinc finger domain-containing protein [Pseudomonadota bacterium]
MSFIDFQVVKQEADIEAACSFLQLDLKSNGRQLRGRCPACQSSTERSLVVTPDKGAAYCFSAKQGGDVIWLVSHIKGTSQKEAAHLLHAQFGGAEAEMDEPSAEATVPANSAREREINPLPYLRADHENLIGLGVPTETAEHFQCGHAPKGIMRGKLAIPIHDPAGRLVAYCGRDYETGSLTFPTGFDPSAHVFNAHRIEEGELYLTRDPLEVLLAFDNGVENVVAILSETITATQLKKLAAVMEAKGCASVDWIA